MPSCIRPEIEPDLFGGVVKHAKRPNTNSPWVRIHGNTGGGGGGLLLICHHIFFVIRISRY